jgi:hypothetical protein
MRRGSLLRRLRWALGAALLLGGAAFFVSVEPSAQASAPLAVSCNGGACASGWYQSTVTVAFQWDTTDPSITGTPGCGTFQVSADTTGTSFTCTLQYVGGATAQLSVTVKMDSTAPTVTGSSFSRGPDANGWYNHAVGVSFSGTDATSGISTCSSATYSGPDTTSASFSGTCTDQAGNTSAPATSGSIKYDATPPSVSVVLSRGPDSGNWYNHPVDFTASGSDNLSGIASCSSGTIPGASSAACTDVAGNSAAANVGVNYDAAGPSINSITFDRAPDSNGWYNHPVQVVFHGSDDASGIASCSTVTYAGPDTSSTTVNGDCRDNAGNSTGATSPAFKYDSTPPTLTNIGTDWDDGTATLSWTASPDTKEIQIDRAPGKDGADTSTVYQGLGSSFEDTGLENKVKYVYTLTGLDDAGNKAVESVSIIPGAKLYSPARGVSVKSPPLLAWRPYAGATYYNVQLYSGVGSAFRQVASLRVSGRKVLSAWPTQPHYRLKKTWKWNGKKRSLAPGHYRWYVFPGLGKRSANSYGPLIGSSDFFVVRG